MRLLLQNCFVYPDVEACGECVAGLYQVVDDVEAVVLVVFGADAAVSFFPSAWFYLETFSRSTDTAD